MLAEGLERSLATIRESVSGIHELNEDNEVRLIKIQLRVIERSIRQFEKAGTQVPEGVISDRNSLESKLKEIKSAPQGIALLYDELLEIVVQIARLLAKKPDRDISRKIKELRKKELSSDILRKSIIAALQEMGGAGREREVLSALAGTLKPKFSGSDLERPYGRMARWEMNVRKERKRMIKEGLLTPESIRSQWKLR